MAGTKKTNVLQYFLEVRIFCLLSLGGVNEKIGKVREMGVCILWTASNYSTKSF